MEEIFLQIERLEDKACMFLIEIVLTEERVIADGNVRTGWVEDSQLVHTAGSLNGGENVVKEFLVALAVEDQHGDPVWIMWRTHDPEHVLGDDVLEQCRLAG